MLHRKLCAIYPHKRWIFPGSAGQLFSFLVFHVQYTSTSTVSGSFHDLTQPHRARSHTPTRTTRCSAPVHFPRVVLQRRRAYHDWSTHAPWQGVPRAGELVADENNVFTSGVTCPTKIADFVAVAIPLRLARKTATATTTFSFRGRTCIG
jgi:hypothetical protein